MAAISLFSRPVGRWVWASYEGGSQNTHNLSAGGSYLWSKFGISSTVRGFTTDGYYIVPEYRRGTADTRANVRFASGNTRLDYINGLSDRLFIRLDILAESSQNARGIGEDAWIVLGYLERLTSKIDRRSTIVFRRW